MEKIAGTVLATFGFVQAVEYLVHNISALFFRPAYELYYGVFFQGGVLVGLFVAGIYAAKSRAWAKYLAAALSCIWLYYQIDKFTWPIYTPAVQRRMGFDGWAAWKPYLDLVGVNGVYAVLLFGAVSILFAKSHYGQPNPTYMDSPTSARN